MNFAIIDKETDYVQRVCSCSEKLPEDSTCYEIETDHVFSPTVLTHWWKYDDGEFTIEGERLSPNETESNEHLIAYMSYLAELGYSGNVLDIDELEAWWSTKIDACGTLTEFKDLMKVIVKTLGRAQTAMLYGWRLQKV